MPLDPTFRARIPGALSGKTLAELASAHAEIPFLTERWLALQAARAAREKKRGTTRMEALLATARAVVERLRRGRSPTSGSGSRSARVPLDGAPGHPARTAVLIDFETARRRLRGPP